LLIGNEKANSINIDTIYIVVEDKARIDDNNHAQVIGELISCFVSNKSVSNEQNEIYAILTDGINIQFFMLSEFNKGIIIDRSEAVSLGTFSGYHPQIFIQSNDLLDAERVLLTLFNKDYNCRPFQRRLNLLHQLEESKQLVLQLKNKYKQELDESRQQIDEQKQQIDAMEQQIDDQKQQLDEASKEIEG